ncbi:S24 family peptidase [Lacticaseibacillus baoqingensis]|uniref:S24 family peptidase n=1 Tax=Lacticaseibacillus baoqingensis TaxID=2486013 RepID=A0ABW4E7D9_9LACO|nr:S24 family peptidase [Lacticaseibacillus baoqingensis]
MKSTTAQRLNQLMTDRGLKQVDILNMSKPFQKSLGIKMGKSTLSQYVNGVQSPDQDRIYLLAHTLNVSEPWLMGFDVPQERRSSKKTREASTDILPIYNKLHPARQQNVYTYAEDQLKQQQNENVVPLPEQREVVCGRGTAAGAPIDGATQDAEVRRTRVNVNDIPASADEIVTVEGDSMEPDYPKYSQIFVRWQDTIDDGDLAVVRVADEGVTFKQVSRDYQQKKIVLHSLNDKYPDRYLDPEDVSIIGVVIN